MFEQILPKICWFQPKSLIYSLMFDEIFPGRSPPPPRRRGAEILIKSLMYIKPLNDVSHRGSQRRQNMETFRILKADKWMFNENRARCCKERDKRISDCLFPQSRSRFAVDTQRSDFWFTATVWGCSKRHGTPCAALCIYFIIVFNSFWLDPFCERFPLLLERVDSLLKPRL